MTPDQIRLQACIADIQAQAVLMRSLGLNVRPASDHVGEHLLHAYAQFVKHLRPAATLEIGAHEAKFSRVVRKWMEGRPVIAFEANPDVHARHLSRANAAGVDYRNLAIARGAGRFTLHVPIRRGRVVESMGSLIRLGDAEGHRTHEVETVALDSFGLGDAMLWIDVEGAIADILAGAGETLRTAKAVFVEVEDEARWAGQMVSWDVIAALAAHGLYPVLRDIQRSWQYNLIFLRGDLLCDQRVDNVRSAFLTRVRSLAREAPDGPMEVPG